MTKTAFWIDMEHTDANKRLIIVQKKLNPSVCYARMAKVEGAEIIRVFFPDEVIKNAA